MCKYSILYDSGNENSLSQIVCGLSILYLFILCIWFIALFFKIKQKKTFSRFLCKRFSSIFVGWGIGLFFCIRPIMCVKEDLPEPWEIARQYLILEHELLLRPAWQMPLRWRD